MISVSVSRRAWAISRGRAAAARKSQFNSEETNGGHSQQLEAVPEAVDIGAAVLARQIPDGNIDHAETHDGGREKQFKITEGVEIAKVRAPCDETPIVMPGKELGAA